MATKKRIKTRAVKLSHRPARAKKVKQVVRVQLIYLLVLIFALCQILMAAGWFFLYRQTVLSFQVNPSVTADLHLRGELPTQVALPRVKIDLPVVATEIKDGQWQIPGHEAGFLASSARPGEGGNIVIYAHNLRVMFGPLAAVKLGDEVVLKTAKGEAHYTVSEKMVVGPKEINVVLPTDHEVLTLYTCTGFMDSQRLVVRAVLK